jgi:6-phosphogluconolactonase (cycloisomerase 2 family)
MTDMKSLFSKAITIAGLIGYAAGLSAQTNFVYTNNDIPGGNSVSAFAVSANGGLAELPNSPFATGGGGTGGGKFATSRIVVSGGKYLYASNGGTANISAFAIDPSLGGLTSAPGSPFSAGTTAAFGDISLAASPDGKFLFAGLVSNNTVVSFTVNADGSLSQAATINVPAAPDGMKATPDGHYLAVALPAYIGFGAVAMFSIAPDGTLSMINNMPFIGSGFVAGVDVNCASSQLFGGVITQNTTLVDAYDINSGGTLSRLPGSPFSPGVGTDSNVVLLTPNDLLLFVSNQFSNSITAFSVDPTGALTLAGGSPFSLSSQGANPAGIGTDQGGAFLYVASNPNLIQVLSIATGGQLTPVTGSPFSTNQPGMLMSLAAFPAKTCGGSIQPPPPPPVVSGLPASGCTLWPPNRRMVQVATVTADAAAGLASFNVTGTSSEPSDPNSPDIVITGDGLRSRTVQLRADRLGNGLGRVYTLTAIATDLAGQSTSSTATCTVPHDQRN